MQVTGRPLSYEQFLVLASTVTCKDSSLRKDFPLKYCSLKVTCLLCHPARMQTKEIAVSEAHSSFFIARARGKGSKVMLLP